MLHVRVNIRLHVLVGTHRVPLLAYMLMHNMRTGTFREYATTMGCLPDTDRGGAVGAAADFRPLPFMPEQYVLAAAAAARPPTTTSCSCQHSSNSRSHASSNGSSRLEDTVPVEDIIQQIEHPNDDAVCKVPPALPVGVL